MSRRRFFDFLASLARSPRAAPGLRTGGVGAAAGAASLADFSNLVAFQSQYANQFQNSILYPPDLFRSGEENQAIPFISMQFEQYERRSINVQPFYREVMRIRLPIPDNLVERTSVTYNKMELGSAVGSVVQSLSGATDFENIGGVQGILDRVVSAGAGVGTEALTGLARVAATRGLSRGLETLGVDERNAGNIAGGVVNRGLAGLSALTGITANPFEVILFKSPEFRTHRFSWKFIPNNIQETELLRTLIENFKYHSLPGISAAGAVFFSYPEILKSISNPVIDISINSSRV
jgi:hypothetical protein